MQERLPLVSSSDKNPWVRSLVISLISLLVVGGFVFFFVYKDKIIGAVEEAPSEVALPQKELNLLYPLSGSPHSARLLLYRTDGEGGLVLEIESLSFRQEKGLLRLGKLDLPPGNYRAEIRAQNYVPIIVVFMVSTEVNSYSINLGPFLKLAGAGASVSATADLNNDGLVNSLDFATFLELYKAAK